LATKQPQGDLLHKNCSGLAVDDTVPPNIVSYRHDRRGQWRSEAEGISGFGEVLLAAVVLSVPGCVLLRAE